MELQERAQCGSTFRLKHRVRLSELWVLCRQEAAVAAGPEDDEEVFGLKCSQTLILVWPSSLCVVTFGSPEVKQLWLDAILRPWRRWFWQRLTPREAPRGRSLRPGKRGFATRPELLALLYEKGPATEGIFRKAATEKARRELKEDLNRGRSVDLASQPAHLLAAVLKDFLRNIPSKLLVAELYDKWLLALEKPRQQEKIEALREVAGKLPRANLLLLQRLLSVLHHISDNAESNRMDASNLAICVGPNMLSPDMDNLLPLAVQKESIDKVTLLVAFLIENCAAVFGEDVALPLRPSADESPEHTDSSTERPCAAPQNSCACDSPEAGAAGSPPPSDMEQPKGGSASVSSSYPTCASVPLLAIGKKDISRMERSFSEPNLSF
ncbi:T-cell activation Rho GTPase-activating protein-like [Struthio camelus]|uniref:T-cell activation Rho GTPase-activating protein-like n=1 Tax=Struthio camelus TaxID=8801 RepID=UPI0036040703